MPLTHVRGSVDSVCYRTATVRESAREAVRYFGTTTSVSFTSTFSNCIG